MSKVLIVSKPERCIGCGLCVLEASSQVLQSGVSVSNSPIRVTGKPGKFKIVIDYGAKLSPLQIKQVCPRDCFDIEEAI